MASRSVASGILGPIGLLIGFTAGTGPALALCQGTGTCDEPCPAANSCWRNADCPPEQTCVPYGGAPGQQCRPGSCFCDNDSWACSDDCAPQCTVVVGTSGEVPDRAPASPLTLSKVGDGLRLDWSASCLPGDIDYEVYDGSLGSFNSHFPVTCSTGVTSATIPLFPGNRYYLVVPTNGSVEGSYGRTSAGAERAQSFASCLPQAVETCPP